MGWGEVGYVTPLDTPAPNRALTLCKLLPAPPGHIPRSRRTTAFPNQRPDTPARPSSFHVSTNLPAACDTYSPFLEAWRGAGHCVSACLPHARSLWS